MRSVLPYAYKKFSFHRDRSLVIPFPIDIHWLKDFQVQLANHCSADPRGCGHLLYMRSDQLTPIKDFFATCCSQTDFILQRVGGSLCRLPPAAVLRY